MDKKRKNWNDLLEEGWTEEEIFDAVFSEKLLVHNTKDKSPINPIKDKLLHISSQIFGAISNFPEIPQGDDNQKMGLEQTLQNYNEIKEILNDLLKNSQIQTAEKLVEWLGECETKTWEREGFDIYHMDLFDFDAFYKSIISILEKCLFEKSGHPSIIEREPSNQDQIRKESELPTFIARNPFFIDDTRLRGKELKGKEAICKYINISPKSYNTLERFRKNESLPVRSYPGKKGRVYAFTSELDLWRTRK